MTMPSEEGNFGDLLRRYRMAAHLTQAERANLSLRGINDLERGVRTAPRRETVRLLAEALMLQGMIGRNPWRPLVASQTGQALKSAHLLGAVASLREAGGSSRSPDCKHLSRRWLPGLEKHRARSSGWQRSWLDVR